MTRSWTRKCSEATNLTSPLLTQEKVGKKRRWEEATMCFTHHETRCCKHCLLPLFTDPRPYRLELCLSARRASSVPRLGQCVQQQLQRHETRVANASCVEYNAALYSHRLSRLEQQLFVSPPLGWGVEKRSHWEEQSATRATYSSRKRLCNTPRTLRTGTIRGTCC